MIFGTRVKRLIEVQVRDTVLGVRRGSRVRGCGVGVVAAPLTSPICHLPGRPNSSDCNTDGLGEKK